MTWLDDHPKDRTALSGYVAGTTAIERMQLTPHARTLYVVEGGLIGLVRRNGHAHGLHWVQSRQAIRVTLQKNRSKASGVHKRVSRGREYDPEAAGDVDVSNSEDDLELETPVPAASPPTRSDMGEDAQTLEMDVDTRATTRAGTERA